MNQIRQLERRATKAHRDGTGWLIFWPTIALAVQKAIPYDQRAFGRLRSKLMHLVLSGERSGQFGIGDFDAVTEPWLMDDETASKPSDTTTNARFDPVRAGVKTIDQT